VLKPSLAMTGRGPLRGPQQPDMVAPPAALKRLQSVPATPLHSQGNCRRACRTAHARASKSKLVPARPAPAPLCVSSIPKTSDQHGGTAWDLKRSSGPRPPAPGRIRPHTPRRGRSTGTHRRRSPAPEPAPRRSAQGTMQHAQMPSDATNQTPACRAAPAGGRSRRCCARRSAHRRRAPRRRTARAPAAVAHGACESSRPSRRTLHRAGRRDSVC